MQTELDPVESETDQVTQILDTLAQALFAEDFDTYAKLISLPFVVTTRKTRFVYVTRQELRQSFDTWQRTIRTHDATALVQRVQDIGHLGQNGLVVDYDTLLMSGKRHALPRFKNLMFLCRWRSGWKIEQIVSGASNRAPGRQIRVDPGNGLPLVAPRPETP